MHNKLLFLGKSQMGKKKRFYRWALYYFFIFLWFGNVSCTRNMKFYGLWKYVRYVITHIDFIQFSSSNDWSSLTLIQNELWVPKCCHPHSKIIFLMLRIFKKCHQNFNLLQTYYTCYTSLFWVKSGEKWWKV
jgi:hypothetical protein